MNIMMLNGLLHFLLFMLTSAEIAPQSKLTSGLQMDGQESRVDIQTRNKKCDALGGGCIPEDNDCPDDMPLEKEPGTPYCREGKKCCYPEPPNDPRGCPVDAGFFWFPSSNQCFKLMKDHPWFTWEGADDVCKNENLTLAHPFDAIGLRSYLAQRYGQFDAFLNARGDGEAITWLDNGVQITSKSLLWRKGAPFGVTDNYCLILADAYWKEETNQPFWATPCTWKKAFRYPLCELDISKTSGCAFGK